MSRLRAGIIGLGVGEQHIAGYREHPDADSHVAKPLRLRATGAPDDDAANGQDRR